MKEKMKKIAENIYELPKQGKMKVPVRVFASESLLKKILGDKTIEQARNMAMMAGVVKYIVVLPDAHQGYGACIGGVSAYDLEKGVVSPGQTGYDINCGVRLLTSDISLKDATLFRKRLLGRVNKMVDIQVYDYLPKKIRDEIDKEGRILYKK